jgi:hypothetical protein
LSRLSQLVVSKEGVSRIVETRLYSLSLVDLRELGILAIRCSCRAPLARRWISTPPTLKGIVSMASKIDPEGSYLSTIDSELVG